MKNILILLFLLLSTTSYSKKYVAVSIDKNSKRYVTVSIDKKFKHQIEVYCKFPKGRFKGPESMKCRHDSEAEIGISKRYKRDLFKWEKSIKSMLRVVPMNPTVRGKLMGEVLKVEKTSDAKLNNILKSNNVPSRDRKRIRNHFRDVRAKRKKAKVWQAHCDMVTESDSSEFCPGINFSSRARNCLILSRLLLTIEVFPAPNNIKSPGFA